MVPWYHGTMAPWYHGTMVTWCHGVEMRKISARMLRGRFWLENQDFGVSVGAIGIIFRDTSFPTSPGSQNRLFRKIAPGVQGRRNGRGKNVYTSGAKLRPRWPNMLRSRFLLQNQDFGASGGAIRLIIRNLSAPVGPGLLVEPPPPPPPDQSERIDFEK